MLSASILQVRILLRSSKYRREPTDTIQGNERSAFIYNPNENGLESGSGYHLKKEDKFAYLVELMNMNMQDAVVYMTMTVRKYNFLKPFLVAKYYLSMTTFLESCQRDGRRRRAFGSMLSNAALPRFALQNRTAVFRSRVEDGRRTSRVKF